MKIQNGQSVIVILQNPREKIVGIFEEIGQSGLFVRGVDLNYFDDWARSIAENEQYLPMQDYFFPMWRVERMTRDESTAEMPSFAEQFERKTGIALADF